MSIVINLDKAKAIAHDKRRTQRERLFAPLDAVIMKQIPGNDLAAAEQARADIRHADAGVQLEIDAATTVEALTTTLRAYHAL